MLDPKTLDDLARRLSDALPQPLKQLQGDAEQQFRNLVQAAFAKLDLVTREEFEVQAQVLARTRARLEALEAQVAALETKKPG
ncbi:MAG: accessory factor UbiK family protein [Gammaproteobacteria bacterium]|nr:accessory factor UbiK family protein [Gammaproteobacteria bacterium]